MHRVKTEHRYRWRVIDRGRPWVTGAHLTEAQVRRDYTECAPEPLLDTLQVHQAPETADEILDAIRRRPSEYGLGGAR